MSEGLVPPNDLDAEGVLLSAALLNADARDELRQHVRSPAVFYSVANQLIWQSLTELEATGTTPDSVAVATYLRAKGRLEKAGGTPYLARLCEGMPAVAHLDQHALVVLDKARQRRVIAAAQQIAGEGYGAVDDVDEWCQRCETLIFDAAARQSRDAGPIDVGTLLHTELERIREQRAGATDDGALSTGYGDLDRLITGWYRGDLTVIAGRPGMGKTAFVLCCMLSAAKRGHTATLNSLEMPRRQLAERLLAIESGVDFQKIRACRLDDAEFGTVALAADRLRKLPIHLDDKPTQTLADVRGLARRASRRFGPVRILALDYLQLTEGKRERGDSREQEIAWISRQLKATAKELDCSVIALSQLNRSVESRDDKRPQLRDLRESGAIEQDADNIMFLYRDEYYDRESEDRGVAELIVAKQRNGPNGMVKLAFVGPRTTFYSLARGWSS